jgi:hypothetical protein
MIKIIIVDDTNSYCCNLTDRIELETGCEVLAIVKPWEGRMMTRYLKSAGQVEYEKKEDEEDDIF